MQQGQAEQLPVAERCVEYHRDAKVLLLIGTLTRTPCN
jgi:hypothetical protein